MKETHTTSWDLVEATHKLLYLGELWEASLEEERPGIAEQIRELMDLIEGEGPDRLDALRAVAQRLKYEEALLKDERDLLNNKIRAASKGQTRVRDFMFGIYKGLSAISGDERIRTPRHTYWIGTSSSIQGPEDDLNAWRDQGWLETVPRKDKAAAKAVLKSIPQEDWPLGFRLVQKNSIRWR